MEVALSSPDGLYLRDVIDRLDALRGKGMARMYSWASKRSYRNGFVWHDLADDDYVPPVGGREAQKAEEAVDLHDRCIPRKPKSKKDGYQVISCTAAHASGKRIGA
uniref:SOSEKI DIX-like domain-containing protein n=1 Tax=Aegilops tauschii TaxID=37682 RepID=N1R1D2_AEGTA